MSAIVVPLIGIAIYLLSPQPAPDRVVLLPGPDGKAGAVIVKTASGEQRLDTPYASAEVAAGGAITGVASDAATVNARYAATLQAQPKRPVSLTVFFVSGSDEFTAESLPVVTQLKAELTQRPAPEVVLIGHTDRVGAQEANDQLSLKRAEALRQVLVAAGVPRQQIDVAGRGERESLVATADEVAEARNRRVEISIR